MKKVLQPLGLGPIFFFRMKLHPLEGMKFVIGGKLKESKSEVTKKITSMGGSVVSKCDKMVVAVISTKGMYSPASQE